MSLAQYSVQNVRIYNERIINDIIHFASAEEKPTLQILNEQIENSTIVNNVTILLSKSVEFEQLVRRQKELEDFQAHISSNNLEKQFEISSKINHQKKVINQYVRDYLDLAEKIPNIEINTETLRSAKEYFDKGELTAARAVFDVNDEEMQDNNNRLVKEKKRYEQKILPELKKSSDEYYFRALLQRTAYDNPNWLENTCDYFERSINAFAQEKNIFDYAEFLQNQNQLSQAEIYYQKYRDEFAAEDQFKRATTLNSLACLHLDIADLAKAETEFDEALTIYRKLEKTNPATYKLYVTMVLHNLGDLYLHQRALAKASVAFKEALAIRLELAQADPIAYKSDLAETLIGMAAVQTDNNELAIASMNFEEALAVYQALADAEPMTYKPCVAMTLYNLGNFYIRKKELAKAEIKFKAAATVYQELADVNPAAYTPNLAMTLVSLAIHYAHENDRKRSINYALEAMTILEPVVNDVPYAQNSMLRANHVLQQGWGLSEEEIQQMLDER